MKRNITESEFKFKSICTSATTSRFVYEDFLLLGAYITCCYTHRSIGTRIAIIYHCFVIPKRLRWNINDDNSTNGKALSNNNCKNNILKIKMKKIKYTFKAKEFFHRLYYSRHKRNLQILLHTLTQQGVRINMRSCVN